jgi:hypothetical protein
VSDSTASQLVEQTLVCEGCSLKFRKLVRIGELNGQAFHVRELNNIEVCEYCQARMLGDDRIGMYWVPLSTILLYECRMALMEERKKKLKKRNALEEVQGRLLVGTKLWLVFGLKGVVHGKQSRGPVSCLREVSARTRTGVEFKNENGKISEMMWPELRYINLTALGFEIIDENDQPLVRYEWSVEAQLAAQ